MSVKKLESLSHRGQHQRLSLEIPEITITRSPDAVDENKERGNWSNQFEFLLSCLSYAVGLGNVWRFPYLCYRNGGGAFLIPYTVMLITVGIPLFFMELSFGQYASEGPITIWKICPLFTGIGYAMFLMSALVGIYYNMILAWAMFYFLSSFTSSLPWSSCDNPWNTKECRQHDTRNCTAINGTVLFNGTCILKDQVSEDEWLEAVKENSRMPSEEYFHKFVLGLSSGIHEWGTMRLELAFCLLICWLIVFICLVRGIKSMGKVVYFTAFFPYFVLTILLIRGLTLDGSLDGIKFYLTPDWPRLKESRVWADAAMQIFFSLSPCWGGLISLASYNKFHNNCLRDSIFIACGNCGTSLFAGFVIFGIIGFMANEMGVPVSEVAAQGAGLAFIAYPEAVARLPISPLWSFLFFLMLLTLGLGTQFTLIETVVTSLVDTFPEQLRHRKPLVLTAVCATMFTFGLTMCTQAGMFILQLMDNYCASFSALIIGLTEVIVIGYVYGVDRFMEDIKCMLGDYPSPKGYWYVSWRFLTPSVIVVLFIFSLADMKPASYGDYIFPDWATPIGWTFSFISVSAIPLFAIYKVMSSDLPRSTMDKIQILLQPTAEWGPKLQIHRMETMSPKHTDSQVPLAAGPYELDDENDDSNDSNDSDDLNRSPPLKMRSGGYFLASDNDIGGIRLNIGGSASTNSRSRMGNLSPDSPPVSSIPPPPASSASSGRRSKTDSPIVSFKTDETNF